MRPGSQLFTEISLALECACQSAELLRERAAISKHSSFILFGVGGETQRILQWPWERVLNLSHHLTEHLLLNHLPETETLCVNSTQMMRHVPSILDDCNFWGVKHLHWNPNQAMSELQRISFGNHQCLVGNEVVVGFAASSQDVHGPALLTSPQSLTPPTALKPPDFRRHPSFSPG